MFFYIFYFENFHFFFEKTFMFYLKKNWGNFQQKFTEENTMFSNKTKLLRNSLCFFFKTKISVHISRTREKI